MDKEKLRRRTKVFALRVLKLIRALPKEIGAKAVAAQLVRSGMSVGANYRASLRGRSRAEWLSKLHTCLEGSDELTAIFAADIKTGRDKN